MEHQGTDAGASQRPQAPRDVITRTLNAMAAFLAVGLVLLLHLGPTTDDPFDDSLGAVLVFFLFAPVIYLLGLAGVVAFAFALVGRRGRLSLLTWVVAMPVAGVVVPTLLIFLTGGSVDVPDWVYK